MTSVALARQTCLYANLYNGQSPKRKGVCMSTAVQAKQIDEIMSDLTRLLHKPDYDVLQLRRLEIAVQRLWESSAISAVEYHAMKAFFAIAKQQRQNALDAAINVVQLAPNDPVAGLNALTIFVGIVEIDRSIPLVKSLAMTQRDDKQLLKSLIIKGTDLMQFNFVKGLFERFDALSINDVPVKSFRRNAAECTLEAMNRYGLTDEDMAARLKVAAEALQQKGFDVFRGTRRTLSDGSIVHYMHVNADADTCAELNFDIADALVNQFEDPCGELVSFACRPVADISAMTLIEADQL